MTDPALLATASRVTLRTGETKRETNKPAKPKTKLPPRYVNPDNKPLSRPHGRTAVARSDTSDEDATSAPTSDERLLPIEEVTARTSLSRSEIYRRIALGEFPRPIRLSGSTGSRGGRVAFVASEVDQWIAARVAEWRGENP